jgi:hypothetical protein
MLDSTGALPVEDDDNPMARFGEAEPWKYGPYRVVVTRRVSDEESVSIECYEPTRSRAKETFSLFIRRMHDHMVEYNERVQAAHRQTMQVLDREIDLKAQKLHNLEERIETLTNGHDAAAEE